TNNLIKIVNEFEMDIDAILDDKNINLGNNFIYHKKKSIKRISEIYHYDFITILGLLFIGKINIKFNNVGYTFVSSKGNQGTTHIIVNFNGMDKDHKLEIYIEIKNLQIYFYNWYQPGNKIHYYQCAKYGCKGETDQINPYWGYHY